MNRRKLLSAISYTSMFGLFPSLTWGGSSTSVNEPEPSPGCQPQIAPIERFMGANLSTKIGIVVVGGISRSVLANTGVDLPFSMHTVAVNTDATSLALVHADCKIWKENDHARHFLPHEVCGNSVQLLREIDRAVTGLDMVILVTGLGGVAGTGLSPTIARFLRQKGILTLAVAVTPFNFEGVDRHNVANAGLLSLKAHANGLVCFRNSDIEKAVDPNDSVDVVMTHVPNTIHQLCHGIANALGDTSYIGVELGDLRSAISHRGGLCAFGFGVAGTGLAATGLAVRSPFLSLSQLQQASAALVVIKGPRNTMTVQETSRITSMVRDLMPSESQVMFSSVGNDPRRLPNYTVTILATGISDKDSFQSASQNDA